MELGCFSDCQELENVGACCWIFQLVGGKLSHCYSENTPVSAHNLVPFEKVQLLRLSCHRTGPRRNIFKSTTTNFIVFVFTVEE